jgi:hypothetical protein
VTAFSADLVTFDKKHRQTSMKKKNILQFQNRKESRSLNADGKRRWEEPKVVFVEPKLTKHGELKDVTGFFGGFTPNGGPA